jgi:hypothetical protein
MLPLAVKITNFPIGFTVIITKKGGLPIKRHSTSGAISAPGIFPIKTQNITFL